MIAFTKMHALGNDFVIIDGVRQTVALTTAQIQQMADRHRGIGFDQLLLIEPANSAGVDFNYRIFNANGNEVAQCGNGARCMGRFVYEQKLTTKKLIILATKTRQLTVKIMDDHQISVDMGAADFIPAHIPFVANKQQLNYELEVDNQKVTIAVANVGNPHAVLIVPDTITAPVAALGAAIEKHPRFPQQVNVNFMQIINRNHIQLRVYERGVGETLACGSGACASVAVGQHLNLLDDSVAVDLPGGRLSVANLQQSLWLSGPAEVSFVGQYVNYN